jgi:hypothetical protein
VFAAQLRRQSVSNHVVAPVGISTLHDLSNGTRKVAHAHQLAFCGGSEPAFLPPCFTQVAPWLQCSSSVLDAIGLPLHQSIIDRLSNNLHCEEAATLLPRVCSRCKGCRCVAVAWGQHLTEQRPALHNFSMRTLEVGPCTAGASGKSWFQWVRTPGQDVGAGAHQQPCEPGRRGRRGRRTARQHGTEPPLACTARWSALTTALALGPASPVVRIRLLLQDRVQKSP